MCAEPSGHVEDFLVGHIAHGDDFVHILILHSIGQFIIGDGLVLAGVVTAASIVLPDVVETIDGRWEARNGRTAHVLVSDADQVAVFLIVLVEGHPFVAVHSNLCTCTHFIHTTLFTKSPCMIRVNATKVVCKIFGILIKDFQFHICVIFYIL